MGIQGKYQEFNKNIDGDNGLSWFFSYYTFASKKRVLRDGNLNESGCMGSKRESENHTYCKAFHQAFATWVSFGHQLTSFGTGWERGVWLYTLRCVLCLDWLLQRGLVGGLYPINTMAYLNGLK